MPILKNKQKLDISYIPPKILCRDKEMNLLKTLVDSSGKTLLSGGIGTGKTLLARYTFKEAIYVNCFVNRSEHAILENILSKAKPNFNPAGLPTRKLWDQIPDEIVIILDEIDGILIDDLNHFLYTLSRRSECGKRLRYIAITRDANILRQAIGDDATWSTFAEKAVIQLQPYTYDQMFEITNYRAQEALYEETFSEDIISLIADIAIESRGHMRTAIEILRNSAMLAEQKGKTEIEPEDVREVNLDAWLGDINLLDKDHILLLFLIAKLCSKKAYITLEEIEEQYRLEYKKGFRFQEINPLLMKLESEGFIRRSKENRYTLLIPSEVILREVERLL